MDTNSKHSAEFIMKLAELARRIAERGIPVASLHADPAFAGFWQIELRKDGVALRFSYDSRDCDLDVERCPVPRLSYPNDWKLEKRQSFGRQATQDEQLRFVDDYVSQHF